MRAILLVSALVAGSALLAPTAGQAQTYPWCAQYGGRDGGGGRNCGFSSYAQCMATVHGIGGYCERNSFYTGPERYYGRRHPKRVYRED